MNESYDPARSSRLMEGLGAGALMRYAMGALGAALVLVGLFLVLTVFGLVLDIIESPDTFARQLDAWTKQEAAEVSAAAPTAESSESIPAPETPAGTSETATAVPATGDEGGANATPESAPPPALPLRRGNQETKEKSAAETSFEEFLELVREGDMGRVTAGVFIFLFVGILARIPLALITAGTSMLKIASELSGKKARRN